MGDSPKWVKSKKRREKKREKEREKGRKRESLNNGENNGQATHCKRNLGTMAHASRLGQRKKNDGMMIITIASYALQTPLRVALARRLGQNILFLLGFSINLKI